VHAGERVLEQVGTSGTARYLLGDALGSIRGSSDADGALVGSADYEAFGAVRGTNTTGSVFGFTGEQTDAETGFVYLRARYYDPRVGRFLSRDTVQPNAPGTQGYHVYAYAANNPTTWVDPSGHFVGGLAMLVMTAAFAFADVANLIILGKMAQEGMLTECAKDLICAGQMYRAALILKHLARPLLALLRVLPLIPLAVIWVVTTRVILAVVECYAEARCVPEVTPEDDCVAWEQQDPGGPYTFLGFSFSGRAFRIGPHRHFSQAQKRMIYEANKIRSWSQGGGYVLRSDTTGERLEQPFQRERIQRYQAEVDHRCPYNWNGSNRFSNACVVSKQENAARQDEFPPRPGYCVIAEPPADPR
jgi:RHS repeat-associated protein